MPGDIKAHPDLGAIIKDLQTQLDVLGKASPFQQASVNQGVLVVTDPTSLVRVEIGNLPARGGSPAQYGIRVTNSSGVLIFDTAGTISTWQGNLKAHGIDTGGGAWAISISPGRVDFNSA